VVFVRRAAQKVMPSAMPTNSRKKTMASVLGSPGVNLAISMAYLLSRSSSGSYSRFAHVT
jgi:hypothetical protein